MRSPDLLVVLAACGWSCDLWNALPAGFAIDLLRTSRVGARPRRSLRLRFINPDSFSSRSCRFASVSADLVTWAILRSMNGHCSNHFVRRFASVGSVVSAHLLSSCRDKENRRGSPEPYFSGTRKETAEERQVDITGYPREPAASQLKSRRFGHHPAHDFLGAGVADVLHR